MAFSKAQGCGVTHCRLSSVEREEERQEEEKDEDLIWAQLMKSIEEQASLNMHPGTLSLLDEQREDANLAPHIEELGRKGSVRESSGVYELQKNTGVLRKKERGKYRICVPEQAEDLIMYMYHDHKLSGHMSPTRMMKAIRETYTFPDMGKKVEEWCKNCQCTKAKATLHPRTGMTQSRPL